MFLSLSLLLELFVVICLSYVCIKILLSLLNDHLDIYSIDFMSFRLKVTCILTLCWGDIRSCIFIHLVTNLLLRQGDIETI